MKKLAKWSWRDIRSNFIFSIIPFFFPQYAMSPCLACAKQGFLDGLKQSAERLTVFRIYSPFSTGSVRIRPLSKQSLQIRAVRRSPFCSGSDVRSLAWYTA